MISVMLSACRKTFKAHKNRNRRTSNAREQAVKATLLALSFYEFPAPSYWYVIHGEFRLFYGSGNFVVTVDGYRVVLESGLTGAQVYSQHAQTVDYKGFKSLILLWQAREAKR